MELRDLGYDKGFQQKREELGKPELYAARVTRVDRDRYLVRNESSEVPAEPTGKLLFTIDSSQELPCVGDWVLVQYYNDGSLAIIHELLARKSFLRRKAAGGRIDFQMIASNIDYAFIMQSCDNNFNIRRMERYIVMANEGHIEPIILLSKSDLIGSEELDKKISEIRQSHIGARVIALSNVSPRGLQDVQQILEPGRTYCLLGSSGVGKTTLLNRLLGREEFETGPVRDQDGKGRHTTSRRQLSVLENGSLLIDTPGMRELGMLAASNGIEESFADILEYSEDCRFNDCTHTTEAGCAVLKAIEQKELDEDRFRSYQKLMKESEFHELSYLERRQKDKEFGRMMKTAKKQMKKRKSSW